MTIEKLKELLEAGNITQDEYDAMAKSLEEPAEKEPVDPDPTEPKETEDEKFNKLFQAKFDRAMAQERKEKAELKKKLENLQKKMLTDEEKKQYEFEQQQQELEEQRKELMLEKNKMYAVKAMKKAEISDTEEAMMVIEKLVAACADETEIDEMVTLLKAWKEKDVAAEVNKRFKDNGREPKKSDTLNGGVNPYKKETFNITEQMKLEISNPELAAQLRAAAGVK